MSRAIDVHCKCELMCIHELKDTSTPHLQLKDFQMTLTYKELQAKLKDLRANGYDVQVKLNSKQDVLQQEFDRLTSELVQAIATATDTEVVTTVVEDEPQYCNFFPYEPVREVTDFDLTGNTKQYTFAGATVYFIDGVDYFGWELDQWLTQNKGMACDVEFSQAVEVAAPITQIAVESQPLEVEFLPSQKQYEPLPVYVLLLTFMLLAVAWLGRVVAERVGVFARQQDETARQAWQNLVWMLRCCWFFSLGFLKL